MKKILNLVIIRKSNQVLLGMKKRGFGAGRWNGFGGKVLEGETIEDSARREVKEECGVDVDLLDKRGILQFEFQAKPGEILEAHVFMATDFTGTPMETEEMKPEWYAIENIPFAQMWPGDIFWFPLFLDGKKFKGNILFGESDVILEKRLEEVDSL